MSACTGTESRAGTISRAAQRLRHGFIVAQIALAFVLLAGATLLGLSLKKVMAVSPGFRPDHVLTGECTVSWDLQPERVGIVVDDLAAATEFFVELGLALQGEGPVEGPWVDRVVGLEGVRADIAIMQTPDGNGRLELVKFHSPSHPGDNRHAPANTPGIRHIAFAVEDIDAVVARLRARGAELVGELERYEGSYRLCYVRGPEDIIIELAERIG